MFSEAMALMYFNSKIQPTISQCLYRFYWYVNLLLKEIRKMIGWDFEKKLKRRASNNG